MTAKDKDAPVTETRDASGNLVGLSIKMEDMSLEQLEKLLNAHQIKRDEWRDKCIYLRKYLDRKLEQLRQQGIDAEIARLVALRNGGADIPLMSGDPANQVAVHANVPGAVITVKASKV